MKIYRVQTTQILAHSKISVEYISVKWVPCTWGGFPFSFLGEGEREKCEPSWEADSTPPPRRQTPLEGRLPPPLGRQTPLWTEWHTPVKTLTSPPCYIMRSVMSTSLDKTLCLVGNELHWYRPQRKGNVFTCICHFVYRGMSIPTCAWAGVCGRRVCEQRGVYLRPLMATDAVNTYVTFTKRLVECIPQLYSIILPREIFVG